MFRVQRTEEPVCLAEERQKPNGSYRCDGVVQALREMFYNKCYLCENSQPTAINVEHFKPATRYPTKKFDWTNLYYCCRHCNSMKGDVEKFDDILDPCDNNFDPHHFLRYEFDPFPNTPPIVHSKVDLEKAKNTADLLNKIYSGTTDLSSIESENLVKRLSRDIFAFYSMLSLYFNSEDQNTKDSIGKLLKYEHLSPSSSFLAIKMSVLLDHSRPDVSLLLM